MALLIDVSCYQTFQSPRCLCVHIQRSHWTDTGRLVKRQDLVKFQEEFNVSSFVYTNRLTEKLEANNVPIARRRSSSG